MHWLAQGLRKVQFRRGRASPWQHRILTLLLSLKSEGRNWHGQSVSPAIQEREKRVGHMRPVSPVWRPLAFLPDPLSGISLKAEKDRSAQEQHLPSLRRCKQAEAACRVTESPPPRLQPPGSGPLGRAHMCRHDSRKEDSALQLQEVS